MSQIPVNRRYQALRNGQHIVGNVQAVGNALRMNVPAEGIRIGERVIVQAVARASESAARTGAFAGAGAGIFAGLACGMAGGAILSPVAAVALIIALAIGGAFLVGYVGVSAWGGWGAPIGGVCGIFAGGWLGTWLGAYVLLICPLIGGVFGAYHGSFHGMRWGREIAARMGGMWSAACMSGIAALSISAIWLTLLSFSHRLQFWPALCFLGCLLGSLVALGVSLSFVAHLGVGESYADLPDKPAVHTALPAAALLALTCFLLLPDRGMWTQIRIPEGWLRNWTDTSSNRPGLAPATTPLASGPPLPRRFLRIDANVRSGPGVKFRVRRIARSGSSVSIVKKVASSSWVRVRLTDGTEGFINGTLFR